MDPAAHIYAVNPYHPLPPHQGIIMPPYMQQYYYQPPSSEEAMHNHQIQVPPTTTTSSSSSGALPYGVNYYSSGSSSYPHLYHAPPPTPFCCNHIPHSSYYSYCPQHSPSPLGVLQPPVLPWGAPQPLSPVHHICLPPSYVVAPEPEAPRYKYNENSTLNHCCGCPNHVCAPKHESPIIKVEEKEPSLSETRKKMMQSPRGGGGGGAGDQSLSLAEYPYPIHVARFEDGRNSQNHLQQAGEERKQFPFPFVLVPYSSYSSKQKEEGEGGAENIQNKDGSLRLSQDHPVLRTENGSYKNRQGDYGISRESRLAGGDSEADMKEVLRTKEKSSSSSKKHIPVKDVLEPPHGYHRQHHDDDDSGDDDEKRRTRAAPGNTTTEDGSCSRVDAKKQPEEEESPMKKKSVKLPPVCLRLEPLRKKKTSGDKEGSRSASSPAANKDTATSVERTHSVTSSDNNKKHQPVEKKVKMIEVMDDTRKDGEDVTGKTVQLVEEEKAENKSQKNSAAAGGGCEAAENSAVSASSEEEKKTEQPELQKRRMILSETEAATYIQAVYRGFEVRKSETLEKLKQLGKIHDEVTKMKKSVEDLNFSWSSSSDAAVDQVELTKQKMVIGESIMGLLLRLDTIQGLHPSLRDRRKSIAKELVALQEQLDSITSSRSCLKKKNMEHGDMCCATKEFSGEKEEESPITEVMHQDLSEDVHDVAAEVDSVPIEMTVQQQEEALECSEIVSASEEEEDGTAEAMIKMEQNKSTTRPAAGEVEGAAACVTEPALADLVTTCCRVDAEEDEKSEEEKQKKTDVDGNTQQGCDEDENVEVVGVESCHIGGGDKLPVTELSLGVFSEYEEKDAAEVPISHIEEEPAKTGGSVSCESAPSPDRDEEEGAVSDGAEDGKTQKEEVEHTMSIVNDNEVSLLSEEEEDDDDQDKKEAVVTGAVLEDDEQQSGSGSSSSNVVGAPEVEEEGNKCVVYDGDHVNVGEQVVQLDDNGEYQCKQLPFMSRDEEEEREIIKKEKEQLQEMMQKLMDAGKEQLDVIFSLTSRVRDLERKLAATPSGTGRRMMKSGNNNIKKQKKKAVLRRRGRRIQLQRRPFTTSSSVPSTQLN